VFFVTAAIISACGGSDTNGEIIPKEITIGQQVWMIKNLDVVKFCNGDSIPEAKTEGEWKSYGQAGEAAWCYYDNNAKNGDKYGKLYNWFAVNDSRGLAPKGWHIPSDSEWTVLTEYLGGADKAVAKMKSSYGWEKDGNGTNSSGFLGLPGGYRNAYGIFNNIGKYGNWWSSTKSDTLTAWIRELNYDSYSGSFRSGFDEKGGFSVRCIKD
jgi:uncharacterized protein (TIGR02145 family)